MQMKYTYGQKGQKGFGIVSKQMTLLPALHRIDVYIDGDSQTSHEAAVGLDEFDNAGLGSFTLYGRSNANETFRCTTDLQQNEYLYTCATSRDGLKYQVLSVFKLKRDLTYASSGKTQHRK